MIFQTELAVQILLPLLSAFVVSLGVCVLLIRWRSLIERFTRHRNDHEAVQASHVGDPLRLGGIAVLVGILVGSVMLFLLNPVNYIPLLLATLIPVFFAGLWEDLGHGVSALGRFIASLIAACLAVALLGLWVPRGDLTLLDAIMGFVPAGVIFTVFLAALYCHSVNLIDGMNGLAATVVVFSSVGLAVLGAHGELGQITVFALLVAAATLGFQLLNWPVAKLFLGDAGAYGLGHILVWLGISVVALAPNVAVPAVILVLFYPFADTFHTVLRRALEKKKIASPDRMHLHQKIRRGLEVVWLGRDMRHVSNPATTLLMMPITAGPVVAGVLLWDMPTASWLALVGLGTAFVGLHFFIMAMAKRYRNGRGAFAGKSMGRDNVLAFETAGLESKEVELSQYSGPFFLDARAVEVMISRALGDSGWRLTTKAPGLQNKTWQKDFDTDLAAWEFFMDQVDRFGIDAVMGPQISVEAERAMYQRYVDTTT